MISYIANTENNGIIQKICKMKNILILSSMNEEIDVKQYMKETKVNFNLIKHFIVDLSLLKNTETEIIESIYNFSKLYGKTRVIILATNYDEQNAVLTNLYDLGFYNIINEFDTDIIEQKLLIALSQNGLQKNDARKFKKRIEVIKKENKTKDIFDKIRTFIKSKNKKEEVSRTDMSNNQVYLFSLLLEAITRLVKFICYVAIFIFTSIGLTILVNEQLRNLVFQGFFLK